MPSDETLALIRAALDRPLERFHSALATAVEQVRAYLATHRTRVGFQDAGSRAALGNFAAGRIDVTRFAALLEAEAQVDVETLARVERAFEALLGLTRRKDELWQVDVESGGDLRDTVGRALGRIGNAFGAARVAELSRTGRYDEGRHASLLDALPYGRWTRAERELTPPLLVLVDGADLLAAGLADYLDGALKIVLVVRGPSPPAPLVRLISPGVLVQQAADGDRLERFGAWEGPGVAAIVPEGAARFLHDPGGGADLSDRLDVSHLPDGEPRKALGSVSAGQQTEDLRQLRALAALARRAVPEAPHAGSAAPATSSDPVDKLAAWLLAQADLPGGG